MQCAGSMNVVVQRQKGATNQRSLGCDGLFVIPVTRFSTYA
jgi:hypothetical protein